MTSAYRRAVASLDARGFGIKADLERIRALTALLDHPQLSYPTVHIAGTNGKTTTARTLGALMAQHGLVSGVYTSPHLQTVRERLALTGDVDGAVVSEIISEEEFAQACAYLMPFVEMVENERDQQVTYFEFLTALAFGWMADKAVAVGVYEAGLGGRWDATNVVESRVAVFTHIAVDHRRLLGTTPVENAREKSGIIKPGSRVVSASQDEDVAAVIADAASRLGADVVFLGSGAGLVADVPAVGGRLISIKGVEGAYSDLFLPLFGAHQARNAAVAVVCAEAFLGRALDEGAVATALRGVRSPGRMEIAARDPLVILDGAHNPDGAAALAQAVRETFVDKNIFLVLSIFEDKDISGMLPHLVPMARKVFTTTTSSERSMSAGDLAGYIVHDDVKAIDLLAEAIEAARSSAGDDDVVLVTGSLMTVGEARDHLVGQIG